MKKTGVLLLVMVTFLALPVVSRAMMEMAVGAWDQNFAGDLSYNPNNRIIPGADGEVDVEDDLDVDPDTRGYGWLKLELIDILPNIYLGFTPMDFEGKATRDRPLIFGDAVFDANTTLRTQIDLNHLDVGLYYSIPFLQLASLKKLNVDLGLNLRTADLDAEIIGTETVNGVEVRTKESESYTLPIPMLFAAVQIIPVEDLSLEFEARGVSLQGNHLFSALGKVKYKWAGPLFVAGGYRYDDIYLDEDDIELDSTISGVFIETGVDF